MKKKYIITVQKVTLLKKFDRKNTVFEISRNVIDKLLLKLL